MLMHDEKGETTKFTACLVTIHAFTKACPDLLRETQISTLQPYLSITNPVSNLLYAIDMNAFDSLGIQRAIGKLPIMC